jgi:carboxymethylenebutenolidase
MTASDATIQTADGPMRAHVALPRGDGPFPGLIVIQHAGGVDEFIRALTDRFARAGYAALAPDLYHRLGKEEEGMSRMAHLRDGQVIADVSASVDALAAHDAVDDERIGIAGFCMGGRVTYMMAAAEPRFRAAAAFYGGNTSKSWGDDGRPTPFERTADIDCPLLFHFGGDDGNPSPDDMRALDAELTAHGKEHEFHAYEGAGHAFMDFTRQERFREEASHLAWDRTRAFLDRHLQKPNRSDSC